MRVNVHNNFHKKKSQFGPLSSLRIITILIANVVNPNNQLRKHIFSSSIKCPEQNWGKSYRLMLPPPPSDEDAPLS